MGYKRKKNDAPLIRKIIEATSWSQGKMSKILGVSRPQVSHYVDGRNAFLLTLKQRNALRAELRETDRKVGNAWREFRKNEARKDSADDDAQ